MARTGSHGTGRVEEQVGQLRRPTKPRPVCFLLPGGVRPSADAALPRSGAAPLWLNPAMPRPHCVTCVNTVPGRRPAPASPRSFQAPQWGQAATRGPWTDKDERLGEAGGRPGAAGEAARCATPRERRRQKPRAGRGSTGDRAQPRRQAGPRLPGPPAAPHPATGEPPAGAPAVRCGEQGRPGPEGLQPQTPASRLPGAAGSAGGEGREAGRPRAGELPLPAAGSCASRPRRPARAGAAPPGRGEAGTAGRRPRAGAHEGPRAGLQGRASGRGLAFQEGGGARRAGRAQPPGSAAACRSVRLPAPPPPRSRWLLPPAQRLGLPCPGPARPPQVGSELSPAVGVGAGCAPSPAPVSVGGGGVAAQAGGRERGRMEPVPTPSRLPWKRRSRNGVGGRRAAPDRGPCGAAAVAKLGREVGARAVAERVGCVWTLHVSQQVMGA